MIETVQAHWSMFLLAALTGAAVYAVLTELPFASAAWRAGKQPPPKPACPVVVIDLVAVPPGQEATMRERNRDLFTVEEARRVLDLFFPVAGDERDQMRQLLGGVAALETGNAHLVRLGRRGFHGA